MLSVLGVTPCVSARTPVGCSDLEDAPRAATNDRSGSATLEVWRRLHDRFVAATGRRASLAILAPSARGGGSPLPAMSLLCPGPVVYVTHAMLDDICFDSPCRPGQNPLDFLVFVLGHELGHREIHMDHPGTRFTGGLDLQSERQADRKAAYYTALAGFSPRKIAQFDLVARFLENHRPAPLTDYERAEVARRRAELVDELARFETYEGIHELALVFAWTDTRNAADRLFDWVDENVNIPEFKLAQAIALIQASAADSPWIGFQLPTSRPFVPRCTPVYANNTALWEPGMRGRLQGEGGLARQRARTDLLLAGRLLSEAAALGATAYVVKASQACVAFYLGAPESAIEYQRGAFSDLPDSAPASVRSTLQNNEGLLEFARFLSSKPPPPRGSTQAARTWAKQLLLESFVGRVDPETRSLIAALGKYPSLVLTSRVARHAGCGTDQDAVPEFVRSFARDQQLAVQAWPTGGSACPTGWSRAFVYPPRTAAATDPVETGVVACDKPLGKRRVRAARLRFPETSSPPSAAIDDVIVLQAMDGAAPSVDQLPCHCAAGDRVAISPTGETVYAWTCPPEVALGLLVVDAQGSIRRGVSIVPGPGPRP